MITVSDVVAVMDGLYPPSTAFDWDAVGLTVGDPQAVVTKILYAVEVSEAVVAQARELRAELIIAHHPLLLRGVHAVTVDQPKGRLITDLVKSGIGLLVAHTNADLPPTGTADSLAQALGLVESRPLQPVAGQQLDKITTFVPSTEADRLIDALAAAGAGALGDYDRCAFTIEGTGTFRPLAGSHPYLGRQDEIETVVEKRIEMVLDRSRRAQVIAALLAAHPYETPAFDLIELAPLPGESGLGRIGRLNQPVGLKDFVERVADVVPQTAFGVLAAGDPEQLVSTVAIQAGAGDDLLETARRAGADVYLTSDLRHHPAAEARQWADAPALINVSHWAAEWLWLPVVQGLVASRLPVDSVVSQLVGDPWTFHVGSAEHSAPSI